jgi:hypothetical protein
MIIDEMNFSDFTIRQTALQMAIEATRGNAYETVRIAKEFEAYLRGETEDENTQEPAKAA